MSRFNDSSNLSYRDRSGLYPPPTTSAYATTPPHSGRSSPYPFSSVNAQQRSLEDVENQNDETIEGLSAKVKMLKDLTIGIGNEVRDSTIQLTQMNDAFAETGTILGGTFRRMNAMATRQGGRWACYMIFMFLVMWFFIVVWWFRR